MIASDWTSVEFFSLSDKQKHKSAAELLRKIYQGNNSCWTLYRKVESWLELTSLDSMSHKALSDRFHYHLKLSFASLQEHNLLPIRTEDTISDEPFLPIAIVLDNLRSAFNVGSILRTTEAFRLGTVYFHGATAFIDNPKVQKTSMGTSNLVPCLPLTQLDQLPRPFIGLETADNAPSIHEFRFPNSFSLFLGNEEYGLSDTLLSEMDFLIQIPLVGSKNSLNVASAYAIAASTLRSKISSYS